MNIPLGQWSGSDATEKLEATIKAFNEQSERQTGQMLTMTKVMTWLTVVMTAAVLVQIWLTLKQLNWL
jgi:hypothetical protein